MEIHLIKRIWVTSLTTKLQWERKHFSRWAWDVGVTLNEMLSFCSWFVESAKVYSPFAFSKLVSCTFILSCVTFQMDLVVYFFFVSSDTHKFSSFLLSFSTIFSQQLQHLGYGVIILLMATATNILTLFVYCYFGKLATESFSLMPNRLFESNWQKLPVKLQQYFILMIGNAQQSLHYHRLQIVKLDLETFTKVSVCFAIQFEDFNVQKVSSSTFAS